MSCEIGSDSDGWRRLPANHLQLIDICKLKDSGRLLPITAPPGLCGMTALCFGRAGGRYGCCLGRPNGSPKRSKDPSPSPGEQNKPQLAVRFLMSPRNRRSISVFSAFPSCSSLKLFSCRIRMSGQLNPHSVAA